MMPAPGSVTPSPGASAVASITPMPGDTLDWDAWSVWWRFNRDAYLDVGPWARASITGDGAERAGLGELSSELIQKQIVPALRRALADDPSGTLRSALLLSLARIGSDDETSRRELFELLVAHLGDKNHRVAEVACIGLGILGAPSSFAPLESLLLNEQRGSERFKKRSVSMRMRAFAAYGLGLASQRTDSAELRASATDALVELLAGKPGAAPDDRAAAVIALGMIDPADRSIEENSALAERLIDLLSARNEETATRAHVPGVLVRLAPFVSPKTSEKIVLEVFEVAKRRRERDVVREGSILALGRLGDSDEDELDVEIRKTLTKLLADGNHRLRSFAMLSLAQTGSRPGHGAGDPLAGSSKVRGLLLKRLGRSKSQDRPWNALALGVYGRGMRDANVVPSSDLLMALRDGMRSAASPDEAASHAIALGLCRDVGAFAFVANDMQDLAPRTRTSVAIALGMTGSPAAIEPLHETLREAKHDPSTLETAARALALLHDSKLIESIDALDDDCDCSLTHRGAALALGRSRHPAAVAPLLALLTYDDSSQSERTYAAIGLGYLAERDESPWSSRISIGVNYRAGPGTLASTTHAGILDLP